MKYGMSTIKQFEEQQLCQSMADFQQQLLSQSRNLSLTAKLELLSVFKLLVLSLNSGLVISTGEALHYDFFCQGLRSYSLNLTPKSE